MAGRSWKTKTIKLIEQNKNWSKTRRFYCVSCNNETPPSIELAEGRLCVNCTKNQLKTILIDAVDFQDWNVKKFSEYLTKGTPVERLLVLYRFEEVLGIIGKKDGIKAFQLYLPMISNLGYINQHPLSPVIRQTAHEVAVEVGESLLPVLVSTRANSSPVYHTNILLTAATIDSENAEVQRMLAQTARNSNASVKKILLSAFENIEESWIIPLLEIMRKDENKKIQEKASKLYHSIAISQSDEQSKVRHANVPKDFLEVIKTSYSIDYLRMLYDEYLHLFFDMTYFGMLNRVIRSKFKKPDLIHALATMLYDKDNFWLLMNAMHEDVYTIFERLVWEGGELSGDKLNRTLNEKVSHIREEFINDRLYKKNEFNPKYCIFRVRKVHTQSKDHGWLNDYRLSLPDMIRNLAQKYLPKPEFFELIGISDKPDNCLIFSDNVAIVHQLPLLLNYVDSNSMEIGGDPEKLSKRSLQKMLAECAIQEFYPSGKFEEKFIRSRIIIRFLMLMQKFSLSQTSPEKLLEEMITYYLLGKDKFNYAFQTISFLSYLKNWKKLESMYDDDYHYQMEVNFRNNLWSVLKQMPSGKWITVENIVKYCYFRNIDIRIVHPYMASQFIHFTASRYVNNEWLQTGGKTYVSDANYPYLVTVPAVKMFLFFLASFGMLDIAYSPPENDELRTKGRPYLSEFDGLTYIRLNALGEYVLGITNQVSLAAEEVSQVILDEDHLIAYLRGNDPVKKMVLDKIGLKIHEGCYRVNYQIFLQDCRSKKDIDSKINLFHDYISKEPPQIWQSFIDDIFSKKDPLEEKMDFHVFKVKDNQELIELIAKDDILRSLVLMAEEYYILILEQNIQKVHQRLEYFGFFMDY